MITHVLGWQPGDRLTLTVGARVVLARRDPCGNPDDYIVGFSLADVDAAVAPARERLARRRASKASNLIIRYYDLMKTMTATEASRHFSDLLDAVERGETITIVRGSHPVAEIGPAHRRTGADLRAALADVPPPDGEFGRNIAEAVALLSSEVRDPWADV
jgi:prevent-host-death family protein